MDTFKLFSYGIGLASGFVWALLLAMLWTALAGPLQEFITERTIDRWKKKKEPEVGRNGPPKEGPLSILVSDLHLDFWDYSGLGDPKLSNFQAFLTAVAANPRIKRFYLNGDIMDLPTHPLHFPAENGPIQIDNQGNISFFRKDSRVVPGSLQPEFDQVLQQIGTLSRTMVGRGAFPCVFLVGNHDIGINGLRFARGDQAAWPAQISWNPSVIYKATEDRWVYLEHGHLVDPFLWLYLRYAFLEMTNLGLQAVMQRGGKTGMGKKTAARPIETLEALEAGMREPSVFGWPTSEADMHPNYTDSFFEWIARYRFRHSARRRFKSLGGKNSCVRVVSFGHTHIPDYYQFPGGLVYLNSGDWSIDTPHCCFSLIDDEGFIHGPYQWSFDMGKM